MDYIQLSFELIFLFTQIIIAIFSCHYIFIFVKRLKHKKGLQLKNNLQISSYPFVTIQIPVFNEKNVIKRIIGEISKIEYPSDKFEVQILDDSSDETSSFIETEIKKFSSINFIHIKRQIRSGYKAGALNEGLLKAKGEFIAIFDVDFTPPKDFLLKIIPIFCSNINLGFFQTRWGHINKNHSILTKTISFSIDNHFFVEQPVRNDIGVMNFNGTCGIWRKQSIIECGLWDGNILAEDLDLSYRMYMKNWQSAYSDEIICEGEIPNSIFSYKQQQYRWAKGTMQSARKNFLPIMKSKNLSRNQKIESIFHHFGYLLHLTIFVNFLLLVPLLFFSSSVLTSEIGFFFFVINMMAGSMYFVTANKLGLNLSTTIKSIVKLSLLNAGISWKTSMASLAGLLYNSGEFKRTPKGTTTKNSDYVIHFKFDLLIEFGLIIYLLSGIYFAIINQNFIPGLYLVFCFSSVIIVFYYTVNETFYPFIQQLISKQSSNQIFDPSN